MIKRLLLILCFILFSSFLYGATEVQICKELAPKYKAVTEYRLPCGARVDLLNDEYAIEVDYSKKWAESIGQSIYYAVMTERKPAVILLVKDKKREQRFIDRFTKAIEATKVTVIKDGKKKRYTIKLFIEEIK